MCKFDEENECGLILHMMRLSYIAQMIEINYNEKNLVKSCCYSLRQKYIIIKFIVISLSNQCLSSDKKSSRNHRKTKTSISFL